MNVETICIFVVIIALFAGMLAIIIMTKKRIYNLIEYLNLGLHSSYFVVLFNNFKK